MKVNVNHTTLYYEVIGSGKPLLMVHGNGEDHTIFLEAAELLKEEFTCYLIDSRGHGQSAPCETLYYQDMADDMQAFIEELKLENVRFYGFSDGGIIGLLLASQCDYIEELVVSGANIRPDGVLKKIYYMFKLIYFFTRSAKIKLMLEQPFISHQQLSCIRARTLVLAGSKDLIQEVHTKEIAEHIPGSTLSILEGHGHGSYIVHKTEIAEILLGFLSK